MTEEESRAATNADAWRPRIRFLGASILAAFFAWAAVVGVGRAIGPAQFTYFSAEWGMYFGVVGLLYGYQQEITRRVASAKRTTKAERSCMPPMALVVSIATFGVTYGIGAILLQATIPAAPLLVAVLATGCASYVFLGHMNGVLAGRGEWGYLRVAVLADSLVRFVALCLIVIFRPTNVALVLGIVSGGLTWTFLCLKGEYRSAVAERATGRLDHRMGLAMAISGCSAILMSGFPFLAVSSSGRAADAGLGSALAAITVIRAPIMVASGPVAVLLMEHTAKGSKLPRALSQASGPAILSLLALGIAASYALGPWTLTIVFSDDFIVSRNMAMAAFISSILMAVLTGTGTVLMAERRHGPAILGWLAALMATVLALWGQLPALQQDRIMLALLAPPLLGFTVHMVFLRRIRKL